ncbi:MAG: cytochrome c family protein [Alphaproteobacteria bacterium]|jgi:cytochrome c
MSALEINKLVAAVLVAGLVFMAINVGVDEVWHETTSDSIHYPLPESAFQEPADAVAEEAADDMAPSILGLIAAADTAAGQKAAKKCTTCHDLAKNGPDKVGPNLWGIVGSAMASRQGYKYSDALADLGGQWGYDELDAFLAKPRAFAPGTKMSFGGLKKAADRASIIAFLRMLSDNPVALPGE